MRVRPELVRQAGIPVLQLRQHHLHRRPRRDRWRPVQQRRAHDQGRSELPLRLGWPGRRQGLTAKVLTAVASLPEKAGLPPAFLLGGDLYGGIQALLLCQKIIFAVYGTSAQDWLLWSCRLVDNNDNEHACFGVRAVFFGGCPAVFCPD